MDSDRPEFRVAMVSQGPPVAGPGQRLAGVLVLVVLGLAMVLTVTHFVASVATVSGESWWWRWDPLVDLRWRTTRWVVIGTLGLAGLTALLLVRSEFRAPRLFRILVAPLVLWLWLAPVLISRDPFGCPFYYEHRQELQQLASATATPSVEVYMTAIPLPAQFAHLSVDGRFTNNSEFMTVATSNTYLAGFAEIWFMRQGGDPLFWTGRRAKCVRPVHLEGDWWYCATNWR